MTKTSGTGLATATRKYMSEFIAQDRLGTARAVYYLTSRYQLMGALLITVVGLAGVRLFGEPPFRLMSYILILSITPGVMSWVPAQGNNAFEDARRNTSSAVLYIFSYALVIVLTIHFHWDLVGVASASLVGRTVEVVVRTISLRKRLRLLPLDTVDRVTKDRIRRFCLQAMGVQLLMSVVWDRSELVFLRHFSSLDEMAFYSVSFGLASNLLLVPNTFGSATSMTLMVEASKAKGRVESIVSNASRYLLLASVPVNLGAAAITGLAIHFAYGPKYAKAAPVLIIAALLGIPRAFQSIPQTLLRAKDRQSRMLFWFGVTGVVNIALDAALIPHFGAVGAAWGNGLSQTFGVAAIWLQSRKYYEFHFPVASAVRTVAAGLIMAALAHAISVYLPNVAGLVLAIAGASVSYVLLLKLLHGLAPSDRERLAPVGKRLPGKLRQVFLSVLTFLTPTAV